MTSLDYLRLNRQLIERDEKDPIVVDGLREYKTSSIAERAVKYSVGLHRNSIANFDLYIHDEPIDINLQLLRCVGTVMPDQLEDTISDVANASKSGVLKKIDSMYGLVNCLVKSIDKMNNKTISEYMSKFFINGRPAKSYKGGCEVQLDDLRHVDLGTIKERGLEYVDSSKINGTKSLEGTEEPLDFFQSAISLMINSDFENVYDFLQKSQYEVNKKIEELYGMIQFSVLEIHDTSVATLASNLERYMKVRKIPHNGYSEKVNEIINQKPENSPEDYLVTVEFAVSENKVIEDNARDRRSHKRRVAKRRRRRR